MSNHLDELAATVARKGPARGVVGNISPAPATQSQPTVRDRVIANSKPEGLVPRLAKGADMIRIAIIGSPPKPLMASSCIQWVVVVQAYADSSDKLTITEDQSWIRRRMGWKP